MYTAAETARIIHETFRAIQAVDNDDVPSIPWMWEPLSVRRRAIAGVIRVHEQNLDAPANHAEWCEDMLEAGWVKGDEKDIEKKTHPDIVDWADLDPVKQVRAIMFVTQVHILMKGK